MKVEYKVKKCVCGRSTDHEHTTLQHYVIHEKDKDGGIVSEVFKHGFDSEDDHINEFISECKRDNPQYRYSYFVIKEQNV